MKKIIRVGYFIKFPVPFKGLVKIIPSNLT
jgi:hypothetical protein